MSTKIIVAGGGHGGIAAAALMAKSGLDVTVYEKNSADNMGYDWTDIFDPDSLELIGAGMPDEDLFEYKTDMTFYSTNEKIAINQDVPPSELEIKMERRDIYKHISDYALKSGVKFQYDHKINAPLIDGTRVVGIKTDKGDIYGDLIIDACGCESPVRRGLPKNWHIQNTTRKNEKFYVYRAFYNKNDDAIIQTIKINLYTSVGEMYNDFKLGKLDLINTENVNIEQYIGTIGYNKVEDIGREHDYLAFNMESKVLSNPEVRQAINYAIDENAIISSIYNSKYNNADFPLPSTNWLYQGNTENKNDSEKAKQILQENGWEFKYNYWQKYVNYYTRKLNFRLVVDSSNVTRVKVAEMIKQQLEAIGIKVTIIKANINQ